MLINANKSEMINRLLISLRSTTNAAKINKGRNKDKIQTGIQITANSISNKVILAPLVNMAITNNKKESRLSAK